MASEPGSRNQSSGDPGDTVAASRVSSGTDKEEAAAAPGDGWTKVSRKDRAKKQQPSPSTGSPGVKRQDPQSKLPGSPVERRSSSVQIRRYQRRTMISNQPPQGSTPTTWKNVCFNTSLAAEEDRKLCYIPPKIVGGKKIASLDKNDAIQAQERWSNTITGYIMGKRPFYPHLKANIARQWKIKGTIDIFTRNNGFFLFKLSQADDYHHILEDGPWFFDGRLMILKPWHASTGLDREILNSVPTWIQLPGLNLQAWTQKSIEKIASIVGNPLLLDKRTANGSRMEFARCLVEIEASAEQPVTATIELEDGFTYDQPIIYEWLPKKCDNCISFDHTSAECIRPKRLDVQNSQTNQSGPDGGDREMQDLPSNSLMLQGVAKELPNQDMEVQFQGTNSPGESILDCPPPVCVIVPLPGSTSNNTNAVQSLSQITPTSPRIITRGKAVQASNISGKMDCSSPDLMDPSFPLTIANPDWVAPKFRGPHRKKSPKSLDSLKCLKNLPSSLKRQSRGKAKKEQCISCDTLLSSISNK